MAEVQVCGMKNLHKVGNETIIHRKVTKAFGVIKASIMNIYMERE